MNLYRIVFEHYSQKDSKTGIVCYIIAKNDKDLYNKIKDHFFYYYENEYETKKEYNNRIIRDRGNLEDEVHDLYYGATLYGWELVKENITELQIQVLDELEILITYC